MNKQYLAICLLLFSSISLLAMDHSPAARTALLTPKYVDPLFKPNCKATNSRLISSIAAHKEGMRDCVIAGLALSGNALYDFIAVCSLFPSSKIMTPIIAIDLATITVPMLMLAGLRATEEEAPLKLAALLAELDNVVQEKYEEPTYQSAEQSNIVVATKDQRIANMQLLSQLGNYQSRELLLYMLGLFGLLNTLKFGLITGPSIESDGQKICAAVTSSLNITLSGAAAIAGVIVRHKKKKIYQEAKERGLLESKPLEKTEAEFIV